MFKLKHEIEISITKADLIEIMTDYIGNQFEGAYDVMDFSMHPNADKVIRMNLEPRDVAPGKPADLKPRQEDPAVKETSGKSDGKS